MHNVSHVPSPSEVVFYPMGNTPAVNFLSHHSPNPGKTAPTEVLSLACGDPRSILYSLWCEGKPGKEKFNFTCCDLEPAVLARNVLLFSLMIDNVALYAQENNEKLDFIWNICYHFYLPKQDLALVREQSTKLLNHSETPEKWASSPYSIVKFISQQTLEELRQIWKKYCQPRTDAKQKKYDNARRAEVRKKYDKLFAVGGKSMTFYAGPHWQDGLDTMNKGIKGYWNKGVVGGNSSDVEALGPDGKGFPNPLIMVSAVSESFVVHYTSDPLTGFHLTSVFDTPSSQNKDIISMVTLAKLQFREWSKAFVDYVTSGSVQVNFYYGEAVTFCHELAARNNRGPSAAAISRLYTTQWSSKQLLLDGEGGKDLPLFFDVIDTSNLADWVGLISVLPPMIQILAPSGTSILWTETFRLFAPEPEKDLYESFYMDVCLGSLLTGIAPIGHLLGFGMDNTVGEDINHLDNPNRYRMRIPWKIVVDHETRTAITQNPQDYRVHFAAEELAEIFFSVYLKMFELEDLKQSMSKTKKRPMNSRVFNRYCRMSFATFIQHVLGKVITDRKKFLDSLHVKIRNDETLHIGQDCLLDLILQLTLSGTATSPVAPVANSNPQPPFTCVTLVVPRDVLELFAELEGAPGIHLAIGKKKKTHLFFSIDCFFGTVKQNADGSWAEVNDDPLGWAGTSDLIITTPVPSELVAKGKRDCFLLVTLSIHAIHYIEELGPDLTVYHAASKDKKHVFTSSLPPGTRAGLKPEDLYNPPYTPRIEEQKAVVLSASQSTGPLIFLAKYSIKPDSEEAIALGNAAFVTLTEPSPCSILLKIGEKHSRRIIFPYPVDATKAKTRIARKSLWIELSVPVASSLLPGGYDTTPFPVVIEAGAQPFSWALPRVDLAKQPVITGNSKKWLQSTLHQYTSRREFELIETGPGTPSFRNMLPFYKSRLHTILLSFAEEPTHRLFALSGMGDLDGVADIMLIVNCIRHARETGGMIVDAWVYPISQQGIDNSSESGKQLTGALATSECTVYALRKEETNIWKHLLPAAVESCRRDWKHKDDCEYLVQGKVPLSIEPLVSPICSCGQGMDVKDFPEEAFSGILTKWVTRVALPTLAAPPYVEATGNLKRVA